MKNLSLPKRKSDTHKGDFGHALIIGGDYGMGGAVIMAAEAAYRTGAGKVTVFSRKENYSPLLSRLPNAMTIFQDSLTKNNPHVPQTYGRGSPQAWGAARAALPYSEGIKAKNNPYVPQTYGRGSPQAWGAARAALPYSEGIKAKNNLENKSVIVIGCGLGKSRWAEELLEVALDSNLPKIIDADALNILSTTQKTFNLSNCIITPHVGEAARLLDISPEEIQSNRELSVKKLQEKFGAIVVLKGYGSLICNKKIITKCPYGNPGMATAGMGDVLSGIIGGLVAQNFDLEQSAIYGVNIHAFAGDLAAKNQGEIGMMPNDLLQYIPKIINNIKCD